MRPIISPRPKRAPITWPQRWRTGDASEIRRALNTVGRSLGMTAIAEETELERESLYKALGDNGNPEFGTVLKLMKAMGLNLSALPIDAGHAPASPLAGEEEKSRV